MTTAPAAAHDGAGTATFEDAVAMGMHLLAHADDVRWGLGDLLVALVSDGHVPGEAEDATRARINSTIRKFAGAIKAVKRNTLRGYYDVALFYPPSTRDGFATLSWSHFRAVARKGLSVNTSLEWLAKADAGDWPVGVLSRALATPDTDTVPRKRVFDVQTVQPSTWAIDCVMPSLDDIKEIAKLIGLPGFACELRVSWQEKRETVTA